MKGCKLLGYNVTQSFALIYSCVWTQCLLSARYGILMGVSFSTLLWKNLGFCVELLVSLVAPRNSFSASSHSGGEAHSHAPRRPLLILTGDRSLPGLTAALCTHTVPVMVVQQQIVAQPVCCRALCLAEPSAALPTPPHRCNPLPSHWSCWCFCKSRGL